MHEFNLEEAKNGKQVITRSGNSARIVCFDRIDTLRKGQILALICNSSNTWERPVFYNMNGFQVDGEFSLDLLMKD